MSLMATAVSNSAQAQGYPHPEFASGLADELMG